MKLPNVNRKYNCQIYVQKSANVSAPITKLIITPTSYLKSTYPVGGNDFKASFVFTIYICTKGTFRQVPTRRIRLSFVEYAYSDLRDIYIHFFFS